MDTKTQHGYLVLADISGYTSFVAATELEHAHEILSELLELILSRLTLTLTLSKLEGDAVFAYAPETQIPRGETLLELVEATYVAFRDRREGVRRHTTCTCNACRNTPALDLKFIAHHGDYIVQNVAGVHELVGSDVNLVHRLLKNHVSEATGWKAYALFTEAGLRHMGVQPEGMHEQVEAYEHLGEVKTCVLNLHPRYQALVEARREFVAPQEADVTLSLDIAAPPPVVWEWINDPYKRSLWGEGAQWSAGVRPGGRTSVGARNHCAHGKGNSVETILDWRPFDYVTVRSEDSTMPKNSYMLRTSQLEPLPGGGTCLRSHIRIMGMPFPRWLVRRLVKFMMYNMYKFDKSLEIMAYMAATAAKREQAAEAAPEPVAA